MLWSERLHRWDKTELWLASSALHCSTGKNVFTNAAAATWLRTEGRKALHALVLLSRLLRALTLISFFVAWLLLNNYRLNKLAFRAHIRSGSHGVTTGIIVDSFLRAGREKHCYQCER